ncbi:hypothetical protein LOK49_LG11G00038 [Camellia lanceoleosa]|uniref:Uncharacterized protein n=1 Tax=Camellia lanceoleosa TaxID=1840588 RepID=A0ACC0G4K1_9ERIC|nr:hypothetical protein LOK49_LG11G00038 [Camellia lanceoleosa]
MTTTKRAYKLQEFVAHASSVNCLKIGRKSSRVLVTGGEDHKVNLWAIGKPNAILSLSGHSSGIDSVSFDSAEVLVAAGAASGTIKLLGFRGGKDCSHPNRHRPIAYPDFHPFGEFFASGSLDTNLKIWDIRRKGCIHTYKGHTRGVNAIRFTPDGRWVGLVERTILWDLTAGKLLHDFKYHEGQIQCIDFHPHEFLLATGSADRTVKFWDLETFELIGSAGPETTVYACMAFNPDGRTLLVVCTKSLKVVSWEPIRCHDAVDVGWSRLSDLNIHEGKLLGCSYNQSCVGVWVVDLSFLNQITFLVSKLKNFLQNSIQTHNQKQIFHTQITIPKLTNSKYNSILKSYLKLYQTLPKERERERVLFISLEHQLHNSTIKNSIPRSIQNRWVDDRLIFLPPCTCNTDLKHTYEGHAKLVPNWEKSERYTYYEAPASSNLSGTVPVVSMLQPNATGPISPEKETLPVSDKDAIVEIMEQHDHFVGSMQSRLGRLQMVHKYWERHDVRGAIGAMEKMADHAVLADVISFLTEKPDIITLDICTYLLPLLAGLLESNMDRHQGLSLEMLLKLVRVFGSVIYSTLSASSSVGVDIEAEQRQERCNLCFIELEKVKRCLPVLCRRGVPFKSAQELNLALQEVSRA